MKYLVTIDYKHKKGFEMSEDMVVVAPDQEGAISYLSGLLSSRASVKSIARTRAISIEPIESPAPTDWGKEFTRLTEMREKAISEMQNHIPQGRACTLSIPSRHGHIITVLNLPDNGIGFVTEESNITLWPHKVDTEYLFQAAYAVASTTFN